MKETKHSVILFTGLTSKEDSALVIDLFLKQEALNSNGNKVMCGVNVTVPMLRQPAEAKGNLVNEIPKIFIAHPRVRNIVHLFSSKPADMFSDVRSLAKKVGQNCHGVAIWAEWPNPEYLSLIKEDREINRTIVKPLVILRVDVSKINDSCLIKNARHYNGSIDYMLLDKCPAAEVDVDLVEKAKALKRNGCNFGIVISGHVPDVRRISSLSKDFPGIGINARGIFNGKGSLDKGRCSQFMNCVAAHVSP